MKIKRNKAVKANEVIDTELVRQPEIQVDATPDTIVVESEVLEVAREHIQSAIDELCAIATTNNKAQNAIVDLGVISLDLSK